MAKKVENKLIEKIKSKKESTKRKFGAGIMSGLILAGGLMGCTNANVNNGDNDLETNGIAVTEKVEAETYPVTDQSVSEQLEQISDRMAEILREQGATNDQIAQLMANIAKCTTEEQMQNAISTMRTEIEKYISEEIDKKLSELEQKVPEHEGNEDIKFGSDVDLAEMLSILQQMSFDMNHGVRTDYHNIFIEAERFDMILKSADKVSLNQMQLDQVEREIYAVQNRAIYMRFYEAVKHEQSSTGCVLVNVEGNKEAVEDGALNGFVAVDKKGKIAEIGADMNGDVVYSMTIEGDKAFAWDVSEEGIYSETLDREMQEYAYGQQYVTGMLIGGWDPEHTDYTYSTNGGYTKHVSGNGDIYTDEEGKCWNVTTETTNIKFDENGGIESISESRILNFEEPAQDGFMGYGATKMQDLAYVTIEPISQKEMDARFETAQNVIEQVKAKTQEDGKQAE